MSSANETPEIESIELARQAIDYVLKRIQKDENIRYHMGVFTEAFEKLKAAHCALNGLSDEAVEMEILGQALGRKANSELIADIKNALDEFRCGDISRSDALDKITAIIG